MKQKTRVLRHKFRQPTTLEISLDRFETKLAVSLGEGDLLLGVRRAVVLSGLRLERSETVKSSHLDKTPDPLTLVTDQMADLAAQLKEMKDDPSRREEIAVQITRLGKLYLAIVNGTDISLDDR